MSEEDGRVRKGYRLTGRVQGVGFRWWTQKTARELGLSGTVRNCADGSVEIHVRGPDDAMDTFSDRIQSGPRAARVESVEEIESQGGLPDGFRIVR